MTTVFGSDSLGTRLHGGRPAPPSTETSDHGLDLHSGRTESWPLKAGGPGSSAQPLLSRGRRGLGREPRDMDSDPQSRSGQALGSTPWIEKPVALPPGALDVLGAGPPRPQSPASERPLRPGAPAPLAGPGEGQRPDDRQAAGSLGEAGDGPWNRPSVTPGPSR